MTPSLSRLFPTDSPPKRILLVRLSAHGDIIHTLPLLSALKDAWPDCHIGWLTEPGGVPLLEGHPLIDRLHIAHRPRWVKELAQPTRWMQNGQQARQLWQDIGTEGYELSIDVQGLLKSAVWPWLAKIPIRLGFNASREQASRFYTHTIPPMDLRDGTSPAVQRYLDFARALGITVTHPRFVLTSPSPRAGQQATLWLKETSRHHDFIALAPFTRWESKHWIPDYWASLIRELLMQGHSPVLLGAPGDRTAVDDLLNRLSQQDNEKVIDLVGRTDWPAMQAVLSRCLLLVGPDSAPLHLMDALGKPVLALFGPTAPGRTGPIGPHRHILTAGVDCQPCFQRRCPLPEKVCMTHLQPERVAQEILTITAGQQNLNTQYVEEGFEP